MQKAPPSASPDWGADRARALVNYAKRSGKIPPPSDYECADCGAPARVYDHRDYNKPLEVVAVCQSCNVKRGAGIPLQSLAIAAHGYECTNLGLVRVQFEAVDFYPPVDEAVRDVSVANEQPAPSLESCWR